MYEKDDIIKDRYLVQEVHSNEGGMGTLLLVTDQNSGDDKFLALKYCKMTDDEPLNRFRREVRLLNNFTGNGKVVQIIESHLDHSPPFYVMKYYPDGDLSNLISDLQDDYEQQEKVFNQMIDCVAELHRTSKYHRDLKPQNFLIDGESIVVSDLGLSMEVGSETAFTRASQFWYTPGYMPPEFIRGGFKHADERSDIYMLGKTLYVLLTGRDPSFIDESLLPNPLLYIIEKCCDNRPEFRYETVLDLKQALKSAYDILLERTDASGEADQLLASIVTKLEREGKYNSDEIEKLIELVIGLGDQETWDLVYEIPQSLFLVLAESNFEELLGRFLNEYRDAVLNFPASFQYAEIVANMMEIVFNNSSNNRQRAKAFKIASNMALKMNRFAAMDTCVRMVTNIKQDDLALLLRDYIYNNSDTYLNRIEPSACQSAAMKDIIRSIKAA